MYICSYRYRPEALLVYRTVLNKIHDCKAASANVFYNRKQTARFQDMSRGRGDPFTRWFPMNIFPGNISGTMVVEGVQEA